MLLKRNLDKILLDKVYTLHSETGASLHSERKIINQMEHAFNGFGTDHRGCLGTPIEDAGVYAERLTSVKRVQGIFDISAVLYTVGV